MVKSLVIVESPTKAKTLRKFLGPDFIVESSVGHVRDLPANAAEVPAKYKGEKWSRLGVNVESDFEPLYIVRPEKKKKIAELKAHLKEVDRLLLATDEDREGEAISWHLLEVLQPKVPVERMVFHEITKSAILAALADTRQVDSNMVEAQESRRIIDRLYGYEVSPTLWRKIGPKLSAGRVQSVAIRMLVERERARMRFKEAEYWDLMAHFTTDEASPAKGKGFDARLVSVDGKRVASGKDFDPDSGQLKPGANVSLLDAKGAEELRQSLMSGKFTIASAEEKPFKKSPAPPFTTSTLQQEGNRKLRFDAKRIMRAAQRLYENGFITYMRTDSVNLSDTAIEMARTAIGKEYGEEFLPAEPRRYKSKVKNAQEAHEAIRTAGDEVLPTSKIRATLGEDEAKIYDLIRSRTLASQMKDAQGRRMVLKVEAPGGTREVVFQASGSVIDFHGFLRAYIEADDEGSLGGGDGDVVLPPVEKGDSVTGKDLSAEEHHTTPPARLTEASLVKALEESGIGRPSTYASIIDTIQTRSYSFKKGSALVPTFTAFAVVFLMENYFSDLVDPAFTARMEERLDAISRGEDQSKPYLRAFYLGDGIDNGNGPGEEDGEPGGLKPLVEHTIETIDPRRVCTIPIGQDDQKRDIIVRVGRYGPFLQREETTAPLPDPCCPDEVTIPFAEELLAAKERSEQPIGEHPETKEPVYVKTGRYGPYVQLGELTDDHKPKMASLLKGMRPDSIDFDTALQLLALPRTLGKDAEGEEIQAFNGRYGPYIKRGSDSRSLTAEDNLLTVDLKRALELLAQEKPGRGRGRAAEPMRTFENVKEVEGGIIKLMDGRYGPYVTDGETNASLPKGADHEKLSLQDALDLLEARRAAGPSKKKKKKKKAAKKKAAKKPAAKKKAAKKPAAKKKAAKKPAAKKAAAKKTASKKKASKKAATKKAEE